VPEKSLPNYRLMGMLRSPQEELVPWNYRELIQGWIYKHLGSIREQVHNALFSLFTFSFAAPSYTITEAGISSDTWLIRIASAHQEILDTIEKQLSKGIELDNKKFDALAVVREIFTDEPVLFSNPIVTFDKQTKQYQNALKQTESFNAAVAASLANRWKYFTGEPSPKIVFSFKEPPRVRKIQYKNRLMVGFEGIVELQTAPEMIQFAQCVGLGAKPSCGMGLVV